jgi:hypothetical protein
MSAITIIGVDLAKRVLQLHGAKADGSVAFRKKLSRGRFLSFLADQPRCAPVGHKPVASPVKVFAANRTPCPAPAG